jgi:hypothetical protein
MASGTRKSEPTTAQSPDWIQIEVDYRAGIKTLRQIADEHGITHGAINKRAKRDEWTRDIASKIQAKADAKVSKAAVSSEVSKKLAVTEQVVIEANAELQYSIRMGHRSGLARLRDVKDQLLEHVETVVRNLPEIDQVVQMLRKEGENGLDKANDAMRRAMERSTVIDDLKKLAEIDERVRKGECLAFNIPMDGADPDGTPANSKKRVLVEFVDAVIK